MESLLSQAEFWQFLVEYNRQGFWQILPQQPDRAWKLQQADDKWLLIVGGVPQVNLQVSEAKAFLERRRPNDLYRKQNSRKLREWLQRRNQS